MAVILSVSITKEQQDFLEETNSSPSSLLQSAINEKIANFAVGREQIKDREAKIARLAETIRKHNEFLAARGLTAEFIEE